MIKNTNLKFDICTVVFSKDHLDYLMLNIKLARKINPEVNINWIIVDNSLGQVKYPKELKKLIVKGAKIPQRRERAGSFHHGAGLNIGIKKSKTRFLLVLDPDFFIIYANWIVQILSYMDDNKLSLLGVPWHPRWYGKIRYIPAPHCLFIDTSRVDKQELDFMPRKMNKKIPGIFLSAKIPKVLRNILGIYKMATLKDRVSIGASEDTGIRLLKLFLRNKHKFSLFTPVYRLDKQFKGPNYARTIFNKLIEVYLPESLCFFPKRKGSYATNGFSEKKYKILDKYDYEQFLWQSKTFGFHVRGVRRNKEKHPSWLDLEVIKKVIDGFHEI